LGFVRTDNPRIIREGLHKLRSEILQNPYLQGIPSLTKTKRAFHAKDDCPEVREKVFQLLAELDFKAEFIVGRKIEKIFRKRHQAKEQIFYDDLVMHLFKNKLHLAEENNIYFATRGTRDRQHTLASLIEETVNQFEEKHDFKNPAKHHIYAQTPDGEPCLQVIDYMNWAIQRAFIKKEDRFLRFVENKIGLIFDIYDFDSYPNNFYTKKNPLRILN